MEREKLLDIIMKNHRQAESAKQLGNEAEALAFAEVVQRLLLKHDLEMSEVEYQTELRNDPIKLSTIGVRGKKRRVLWTEQLAAACARAHFCDIIVIPKSDSFLLVGRRQHREVAAYMIGMLIKLGEVYADKAYVRFFYEARAEGNVEAAQGFRGSFLNAYSFRLVERYQDLMTSAFEEHSGKGLIRLSQETALVKEVMDDIQKLGATAEAAQIGTDSKFNLAGMVEGVNAADQVRLKANALPTHQAAVEPKRLGAGQRRLS